jgi:hypothetical protein
MDRHLFADLFLDADAHFSVVDLDVVGAELDREVELVLPGADVVLPAVPGTREDAVLESALAERPLEVEAVPLDGVEAAVAVRERDVLVACADGRDRTRRDVFDACDGYERHGRDPSNRTHERDTLRFVATILLCGVDVFFRGKLEALLPGHHFVTADSADWPDLVIADISRVDPDDVADSYPEVPIVGFGGHTDTAGLRRAHEAGFDQVLVKRALQERAPQIVDRLIAQ